MKKALMILAMVATTSLWAYGFQVGNQYYNIVDDNEFTVQVAKVSDFWDNPYQDLTSVNIPATVNMYGVTYTVVGIEDFAFDKCRNLKHITLPNTIEHIGSCAFSNCTSLTSIVIPEGVTSIPDRAFYGCTSLKSITIPNSVKSIGAQAFYDCSSLSSITIPEGVTIIGP